MTSILHLEDNPLDHKLVKAALSADGLDFRIARVDTPAAFAEALAADCPDLILADYSLPQFSGMAAMRMAAAACPDVPVIIVSGAMGEMTVVEVLKGGATDFVLKDHLDRLAPAVRRAVREAQDRAARRQAEIEVREARDAAEAANRAKDHFLAVLSHELRTPLTPVLTAVQLMEADDSLSPELREYVEMIRRNVELEARLIDDLLDLTRITRNKLELNRQTTDVHEKIHQVLAICDAEIRGKRLGLRLGLDAAERWVDADPARLQQILWNLLKNAVKFTPEGGQITIRTANDGAGRLGVEVSDTGAGIDPAVLPRIFDAFEQGGKQITRQFGGLGLGLAISRALTEQHGGTLTAASEGIDRGATFVMRLPTVDASMQCAPRRPAAGAKGDGGGFDPCNVLLVEDHADTARAMGRILRGWGLQVQTADSVASALRAADADRFDVLISDIGLPDGSGLDLIRQLLGRRPVKGIALSGFGMEEDVRQSREAGFAEHLVKPVNLQQLQAAVRRVLAPSS